VEVKQEDKSTVIWPCDDKRQQEGCYHKRIVRQHSSRSNHYAVGSQKLLALDSGASAWCCEKLPQLV